MKVRLLALILGILMVSNVWGQKENSSIGGRSAGMGNASVTFTDLWSAHNNQAGMAYAKTMAAGVYYENRFLMKEMGLKAVTFVLPVKKSGVFGINYSNFGYNLYNENKVGLAYAMSFGERVSAGVQLDYIYTHIAENYGNRGAFTFEVGVRAVLVKNLVFAAHIFNPMRAKTSKYTDERIPSIIKGGLSYTFSEKAMISAEVEKDINYKAVVKAGAEYHIVKPLYVRIGIGTSPLVNTVGVGLELYNFKIDVAAMRHPVLGYSPQVSLSYNFGGSSNAPQKSSN
ncbi:MAG: hypothetical protein WCM76_10040 [Bacteroidota bacterium]